MGVVRVEEISLVGAQTNTYEVEAMGAHGVIVEMAEDNGSSFLVTGITQPAGLAVRMLDMQAGQRTANHEYIHCGFPIPFQQVVFTWTGAGTRQGRLVFVDEPIAPFGRLVVKKGTTAVAAAGSSSVLASTGLGVLKRIRLILSTNQEGRATLTADYRGTSVTMPSFVVIAGTTGGFAVSQEIPGPSVISLDLVNDDAINVNTFQWAVVGDLG